MWFASQITELLLRNRASVNYAEFSVHPVGKNYALDRKMNTTFLMASTSSITMQSLGTIVQRALAVGAKMWCLHYVFCLSRCESRAPYVRAVHSSNKHCVAIYGQVWTRFPVFFTIDSSFRCTTYFVYLLLDGATIFGEIAVKNCEKSKNRRKSLCAPLRIVSWEF